MKNLQDYILEKYDKSVIGGIEDEVRNEVKKLGLHFNVLGDCIAFYGDKHSDYTEFILNVEKCLKISKTYSQNKQDIKSFSFVSKESKKPIWWFGSEKTIKEIATDLKNDGETISKIK